MVKIKPSLRVAFDKTFFSKSVVHFLGLLSWGVHSINIRVGGAAEAPKSCLLLYLASKQKLDSSIYQLGTRV